MSQLTFSKLPPSMRTTLAAGVLTSLVAAGSLMSAGLISGCRSPGTAATSASAEKVEAPVVELAGVDTSQLVSREKREWSSLVTSLYAPCKNAPVTLAQCVTEKRVCAGCLPAARFLEQRVRQGAPRVQAEKAFKLRFAPESIKAVEIGDSPWKGAPDGKVVIVEWADFTCPHCRHMAEVLESRVERFPGKIKLVYKSFPLNGLGHEFGRNAALAAVAAKRQGKFWELHKKLFENQAVLSDAKIRDLASEVGLDLAKYDADLKSPEVEKAVEAEKKQAESLGLEGTPFIYINGRYFDTELFGAEKDLESWITLEFELLGEGKTRPLASVAASAVAPVTSGSAAPAGSGAK